MADTSTNMVRLESFPFDSKADDYDANGYPVYDRAVGASVLRDVFAKFFTNGIFPSPGTALQIGKADTGLAVTIQPGIGIINGAMGGVEGDAITVQLDTAAPQGNVAYGIMLRYDNTDSFTDSRSLLINVVRSDAATTPTPPDPDTASPDVYELRLGYVVVPSGATDMSAASVTNEKGSDRCPYAAPFVDIDLSEIYTDANNKMVEETSKFEALVEQETGELQSAVDDNMAFIQASIDGTMAGHLQNQIDAIQVDPMTNLDIDDVWGNPYVSPEMFAPMTDSEVDGMFYGGQVIENGD